MNTQQRIQTARTHRLEQMAIEKKYGSAEQYWKRIALLFAIAKHTVGIVRAA